MVPKVSKVLLLGSGYVALPLIDYLLRDGNLSVTIGKFFKVTFTNKREVFSLILVSDSYPTNLEIKTINSK